MKIELSEQSLPIFEAISSNVRIQMIHLLSKKSMNIRELAEALGLSSAIMTMHVKKLEKAGIIKSEMTPGKGGAAQKVCSLSMDGLEIAFPRKDVVQRESRRTEVSIGHYTDLNIVPTCGICTTEKVIGIFDDPRYFLDPDRVNAKILWFSQGYIEYKIPNFLLTSESPDELEISMEISSEAPLTNMNWPSDLTFFFNGVNVGMWTSPADYGGKGKLNPPWWFDDVNQFGLLKRLIIKKDGTYMDGLRLSDVSLDQIDISNSHWTFRIAILEDAEHIGGFTLFGSGFGNYNQDLIFKLYYTKLAQEDRTTV
ncbi:transcriptional regulator [Paenibacillus sp. FSL A5-0031]|uniref:ArsR/SmtB family transcription factor n=1 Tax=unclassified Paenibacillus TaxID=185978 RepID=UPI00096CF651|nr:ArsR family transcriptional regulator [Paenibacillus sp. FSL A5-0031]OME80688.1 transcriptional regulator [Paenibacillus sp. FSL A5-0031]